VLHLQHVDSLLSVHWAKVNSAKTAAAGLSIASAVCLFFPPATPLGIGLGVGAVATGGATSISDYIGDSLNKGRANCIVKQCDETTAAVARAACNYQKSMQRVELLTGMSPERATELLKCGLIEGAGAICQLAEEFAGNTEAAEAIEDGKVQNRAFVAVSAAVAEVGKVKKEASVAVSTAMAVNDFTSGVMTLSGISTELSNIPEFGQVVEVGFSGISTSSEVASASSWFPSISASSEAASSWFSGVSTSASVSTKVVASTATKALYGAGALFSVGDCVYSWCTSKTPQQDIRSTIAALESSIQRFAENSIQPQGFSTCKRCNDKGMTFSERGLLRSSDMQGWFDMYSCSVCSDGKFLCTSKHFGDPQSEEQFFSNGWKKSDEERSPAPFQCDPQSEADFFLNG
jgi:hypothetical protein